jgi:hypothetical protein
MFKWLRKPEKFFRSRPNRVISEILLGGVIGYYTFRKFHEWSFSSWVATIFTPSVVPLVQNAGLSLLFYAIFLKICTLIYDIFPDKTVKTTNPEGLNHCCLRINDEICRHLFEVKRNPSSLLGTFNAYHNFEVNIALVAESLSQHIVGTLTDARARDIFISIYEVPNFDDLESPRDSLRYVTHYDKKRDHVFSRTIDITSPEFEPAPNSRDTNASNASTRSSPQQ